MGIEISSEQTQLVINSITDAYNAEGQANPMNQAPMGSFGPPGGVGFHPPGFPPPGKLRCDVLWDMLMSFSNAWRDAGNASHAWNASHARNASSARDASALPGPRRS